MGNVMGGHGSDLADSGSESACIAWAARRVRLRDSESLARRGAEEWNNYKSKELHREFNREPGILEEPSASTDFASVLQMHLLVIPLS